jgi:TonB family protein
MLLQHFGLREEPFGVTPDARFLYLSEKHREALSILESGIENHRGFVALIAPPGLGKTTLLYHMLEQSRRTGTLTTAFVFQTQCNSRELLRQIVSDLGIAADDQDVVRNHQSLHEFLAREANAGRYVIVFIDEAQNLSPDALETVRLLSNFETSKSKLLQIVLAGQPALATKLCSPALVQLKQRLFAMINLAPLTATETGAYITHRLAVAGYKGSRLFSPEAQALIVKRSGGIPRMINAICYGSLEIAHRRRERFIKESIVQDALDVIAPQTQERVAYEAAQLQPASDSFSGSTFDVARGTTLRSTPSSKLSTLEPSNSKSSLVTSAVTKAVAAAPRQRKSMIDEKKVLLSFFAIGSGVLGASLLTAGVARWEDAHTTVREEEIPIVHAMATPAPATGELATVSARHNIPRRVPGSTLADGSRTARLNPGAASKSEPNARTEQERNAAVVAKTSTTPSAGLFTDESSTVSARSVVSPIVSSLPADSSSELLYSASPEYPEAAVAVGLEGSVMLKAIIGADGSVKRPELISGDPILAQAAIRTVLNWRYRPASVNGHPVESQTQIVFRFSLAKPAR